MYILENTLQWLFSRIVAEPPDEVDFSYGLGITLPAAEVTPRRPMTTKSSAEQAWLQDHVVTEQGTR